MMKLSIVLCMVCVMPFSLLAIKNSKNPVRAPRLDALSYPGSTPEIVSPFDTAQLAQIQQCVCQLKSIIESDFDVVESLLDVVISQIDSLNVCGPTSITETGDIIISTPGSYCLANDVMSITITTSFVTLNMSGHIAGSIDISGVASGGIGHIIIENGFIYNSVLSVRKRPIYRAPLPTSSLAIDFAGAVTISNVQIESDASVLNNISITNAGNVTIYDVGVIGGVYGVNVASVGTLLIQRSNFTSCQQAGILASLASSNSLIAIEDSIMKDTGFFGITGGGVNSQLYVTNSQISFAQSGALGLIWTSNNGDAAYCENVIINSADIGFQLNTSQSEMLGCIASNYNSYGFLIGGSTAIFKNCTARSGSAGIVGFFIQDPVNVVFYNCEAFSNSDSGFRVTSTNAGTFFNCNAFLNQYGFLLQGPCTLYNCDSSSNTFRGFEVNSSGTVGLHSCNALSNGGDGFFCRNGLGVLSSCGAIKNQGNGYNIQSNITGLLQNSSAISNGGYGFFDTGAPSSNSNVTYSGNSAVGNTLGDFNAKENKAPFYWVFAKDTAATVFRDVVLAAIVG